MHRCLQSPFHHQYDYEHKCTDLFFIACQEDQKLIYSIHVNVPKGEGWYKKEFNLQST